VFFLQFYNIYKIAQIRNKKMNYLKRFWSWLSGKIKKYWNLMLNRTTIDEKVVETYNEVKDKVEDVIEDVQERISEVKEEWQDVKEAVKEVADQAGDVVEAAKKGKKRRGRPRKK
jgi:methyl-accepting chemotaxis protein|tara:strand:+ start:378 stop:722 length:345 start_codon:yes stop_codon:yes gene_type:complete